MQTCSSIKLKLFCILSAIALAGAPPLPIHSEDRPEQTSKAKTRGVTDEAGDTAGSATTGEPTTTAENIIRQARAYIGPEEKLRAIRSLHYKGKIQADEEGESVGSIEFIFGKRYYQRITIATDRFRMTTVLNEYEGWSLTEPLGSKPDRPVFKVMDSTQIKFMRARNLENLYFFMGYWIDGGTAEYHGITELAGMEVHHVAFHYKGGIKYHRYFQTGTFETVALVDTEGLELWQYGTISIKGVQFPRCLITLRHGEIVNIITFDSIEVNPVLERELFDFPSLEQYYFDDW